MIPNSVFSSDYDNTFIFMIGDLVGYASSGFMSVALYPSFSSVAWISLEGSAKELYFK